MQHPKCAECGSPRIVAKMSEVFCGKCGFVLEEQMFVGS